MALVRVFSPQSESELAVVTSMLEAHGIPVFVHGRHFGSLLPGMQINAYAAQGVMVPEEMAADAAELLAAFRAADSTTDSTTREASRTMNRGMPAAFVMIALAFLALVLLVAGWRGLEARLPGGLPIGNALSALSMILAACAAIVLSIRGSWVRLYAIAALFLAVAWLPVSIALAGNADLNFSEATGPLWLGFTAITLVASFGALPLAIGSLFLRRRP